MDSNGMYRVTRSGRDVYVGGEEGLLQAARDGAILANDLIFDPTLDKWVFARSLSILTGFTLKGRRQVGAATIEVAPGAALSEDDLRARNRRRRALAKFGGMVLIIICTSILIFIIPTKPKQDDTSISKFAEDNPSTSIRYEGTGSGVTTQGKDRSGPSNLDNKAVTVEGTEGEPGRQGANGRRAEVEGDPNRPVGDQGGPSGQGQGQRGDSRAGGGSAGGEGQSEGRAQQQQPEGADQDPPPTENAAQQGGTKPQRAQANPRRSKRRAPKRVYNRPEPSATLPTDLPVDLGEDVRPTVKIKPVREQDVQQRAKRLSRAMRTLERAKEPDGNLRARDLLNARYEVKLAAKSMQSEARKHPDLETTRSLIKDLSKAFMDLCTSLHSDGFCSVKESHPHWPDVVVRSVVQEAALIGMTAEQLNAAWGTAQSINKERRGKRHCFSDDCKRSALLMGDVVVEVNP